MRCVVMLLRWHD
ncbi:hypothetical protein BAE44_0008996 [Dichanthelium oligosanthes]|nr:hypothetical protein BAE44_0008996 [Dichanthelium oligosanthes]